MNEDKLMDLVERLLKLHHATGTPTQIDAMTDANLMAFFRQFGHRTGWEHGRYQLKSIQAGVRADQKGFARALRADIGQAFEWSGRPLGERFLEMMAGELPMADSYTAAVRGFLLHSIGASWSVIYRALFLEKLQAMALSAREPEIKRNSALLLRSTPDPLAVLTI